MLFLSTNSIVPIFQILQSFNSHFSEMLFLCTNSIVPIFQILHSFNSHFSEKDVSQTVINSIDFPKMTVFSSYLIATGFHYWIKCIFYILKSLFDTETILLSSHSIGFVWGKIEIWTFHEKPTLWTLLVKFRPESAWACRAG